MPIPNSPRPTWIAMSECRPYELHFPLVDVKHDMSGEIETAVDTVGTVALAANTYSWRPCKELGWKFSFYGSHEGRKAVDVLMENGEYWPGEYPDNVNFDNDNYQNRVIAWRDCSLTDSHIATYMKRLIEGL